MAADGIEECRLTCGGQGYSVLSGLPQLLASYVQNCTWEGDNNVMCLQMARFLVKQMHAALSGPRAPAGQCAYFAATTRRGTGGRAAEAGPAGPALRLLEEASVSRSKIALQRLQRAPGAAPEVDGERWGANGVPLVEAARAHCRVVLAREFWEEVGTARAGGVGAENAKALGQMAELFTLEMVRESLPTLLADGALSGQAAGEMQERQVSCLIRYGKGRGRFRRGR